MAKWWSAYKAAHPEVASLLELKRARHGIHLRRPDGSVLCLFRAGSAFYEPAPGQWDEIDTELVDDGEFYAGKGTQARIRKSNRRVESIGGTYTQATSRVGRYNPGSETFTSLWTLPSGTIQGDSFISSGPNYEHRIRILADSVRETLTLDSDPGGMGGQPGDYIAIETIVEGITFADGEVGAFELEGRQHGLPWLFDADGVAHKLTRFALNVGGIQYLYTGLLISELSGYSYPIVIDPDFTGADVYDVGLSSTSTTYATARIGAGDGSTMAYPQTAETMAVGQGFSSPNYTLYRPAISFDTSSLGASATITQVNLSLTCSAAYTPNAFDISIRKYGWSADDPINSPTKAETVWDGILAASNDNDTLCNTSELANNTEITSGNLDTTWVNKTGTTYYGLIGGRDVSATTPSANERPFFYTTDNTTDSAYDPTLAVTLAGDDSSGAQRSPGTGSSATSAPYDDHDWNDAGNILSSNDARATVYEESGTVPGTTDTTQFVFASTLESWAWTTNNGAPVCEWVATGNPGGSLKTNSEAGRNKTGDGYWEWTGDFEDLGVPAGATVTGISAAQFQYIVDTFSWIDFARYQDAAQTYGSLTVNINSGGEQTLCNAVTHSGTTSWTTKTQDSTISGLSLASTTSITVRIYFDYDHANNPSGFFQSRIDNVRLDVDYTASGSDTVFDTGDNTYLLKATNFGWQIPTGATITGCQVGIERSSTAGTVEDVLVQLIGADGSLTGNNKADTVTSYPATDTEATYGGSTDTWGATLTEAVVEDADFGVALAVTATADNSQVQIDHVWMKLWYSTGVSAALTGQQSAFAVGTLSPVRSVPLTGQQAAFAGGLLAPDRSQALAGQEATFSGGTLAPAFSANLSGQEGAFGVGQLVPELSVPLGGQQAAFAGGSLSPSLSVSLVGQQAAFSGGALAPNLSVNLSGQEASFSAGVFGVPAVLIGRQATFSAGTLAPSLSHALTGQQATFSAGTLTPALSASLTGQQAAFASGALSPVMAAALPGEQAVFSVGELAPSSAIYIAGQEATFAAGTLAPVRSVSVSGQEATFAAGTLAPDRSQALSGQSAAFAAGTLSPVLSEALVGEQSAFSLGVLTPYTVPEQAVDLVGQQSSFSAGTLGVVRELPLSGLSSTFAAGFLNPDTGATPVTSNLTGEQAAFSAGTLFPQLSVSLTGQDGSFSGGNLVPSLSVALEGQQAAFSSGALSPALSLGLPGAEASFGLGVLSPLVPGSANLDGQESAFAIGELQFKFQATIAGTLSEFDLLPFGGSQDLYGLIPQITVKPTEVYLDRNGWKYFEFPDYTFTENTRLRFKFKSALIGEIHAIGFQYESVSIAPAWAYQVAGTAAWGRQDVNGVYTGDGEWLQYDFSVAAIAGSSPFDRICLANDMDAQPLLADGYWSDIELYERVVLDGQQSSFSAGQLTPNISIPLEGQESVFSRGLFTPVGGDDMSVYSRLKKRVAALMSVTADLSVAPQGFAGVELQFDASASTGSPGASLIYLWDFGDGTFGSGVTTQHTYAAPGPYLVKLRVQDALGARDIKATPISILSGAPTADAGGPYSGDEGVAVSLSGSASTTPEGTTITLYEWDFGDLSSDTGENVEHIYAEPGTYDVTLTVTNSIGETDEATSQAVIESTNVAPTAEANGPYSSAPGVAVQFSSAGSSDSDGTIISYHWDFDDGNYSGDPNPSHVYGSDGNYTATLTVTDNDGAPGQDTAEVTIQAAVLAFEAIWPDGNNIEQGVLTGTGDLSDGRTTPMDGFNDEGFLVTFPAEKPVFEGGRVELDASELAATLTVSSGTPSPLAIFYCGVGSGNTWRCEYDEPGIGRHFSPVLANFVTYPYRPSTGATVKIYAPSNLLTTLQIQNNQMQGTLPSFPNHTGLTNLNCAVNQLTGSLPALGANAWTSYKVHYNQFSGNIPSLAGKTSLNAFYVSYNTGVNGLEAGWSWPAGQSLDFQAISCSLPEASVDAILVAADAALSAGATANINLSGGANAAPSVATGQPAITSLRSKGCTVTVTGGF